MSKRKISEIIVDTIKPIINNSKIKKSNIWSKMMTLNKKYITNTDNDYVSGTAVKNYLLKDPMLDWLDLYYLSNGTHKSNNKKTNTRSEFKKRKLVLDNENNFLNILFKNGNEFEMKIMNMLNKKYEQDFYMVNSEGRNGYTRKNFNKTIDAMKSGIPIIAQAVLFNDTNKTCGIADLLVRSDYINTMFNKEIIKEEDIYTPAPKLGSMYHYRVIDIKWTSMTLCSNGNTIRNEGRMPAYKGQLAIYNCCIGEIQGYIPNVTYIMAKSWKIDNKVNPSDGYNCFDMLGKIEYDKFDNSYIEKTADAINWIRNVRKNGTNWTPLEPKIKEMYPNASNKNDAPWTRIKKDICDSIGEITQIWYVGEKNRNIAHEKGIVSWRDENCTSEILEISGEKRPKIIDSILEVNRSNEIILPKKIKNKNYNWNKQSPVDFYIDFETINKCFCSTEIDIENSKSESDIIFMIGVGYVENDKWIYKSFISKDIESESECNIINEFTEFINKKSLELDPISEYIPRLFHWTNAEITNFNHAKLRHSKWKLWEYNIQWVDMYEIFISEPITIKGVLNFKLKEISKAMFKHKFINICWDDKIKDGLNAMISAIDYYNGKNKKVMTDIQNYNEVDCKVIYEIVDYLRNNHF